MRALIGSDVLVLLATLLISLAFWQMALANYLLFHTVIELLSIVIGAMVFGIAWNTRALGGRPFFLVLGCGLLGVGVLDLVHALVYRGMGVFPDAGANPPTQLWVAARMLEALAFLGAAATLSRQRPLRAWWVLGGTLLLTAGLLISIRPLGLFPDALLAPIGLTPFKVISEYVIAGVFLVSALIVWRQRAQLDHRVMGLLLAALVFKIASEITFTLYGIDVYGAFNAIGHILKAAAAVAVYLALVQASLVHPYRTLFYGIEASRVELARELEARARAEVERERLLAENERHLAELNATLAAMADGMVLYDRSHAVVRMNPAAEAFFGMSLADFQQMRDQQERVLRLQLMHPDGRLMAVDETPSWRALHGEVVQNVTMIQHRPDGTSVWARVSAAPVDLPDGSRMGAVLTIADITELTRTQGELQQVNATLEERVRARTAALEAANKELEAFSYSVSHDLRAPLRSIDGFSKLLLEKYVDQLDATGQDYLARVRNATMRMSRLIDDMLNLSRIGRREMHWQSVSLSELAMSIVSELHGRDPERQVDVRVQPGLEVMGDAGLLRIVLANLLENAWKFTGKIAGARIEVGTELRESERVYFVRDNGAGFDMGYADKLFTPFQRLHTESEFPGSGIGLAIVQRIITRHHGRVWAEGREGEGATIYFTLEARDA